MLGMLDQNVKAKVTHIAEVLANATFHVLGFESHPVFSTHGDQFHEHALHICEQAETLARVFDTCYALWKWYEGSVFVTLHLNTRTHPQANKNLIWQCAHNLVVAMVTHARCLGQISFDKVPQTRANCHQVPNELKRASLYSRQDEEEKGKAWKEHDRSRPEVEGMIIGENRCDHAKEKTESRE